MSKEETEVSRIAAIKAWEEDQKTNPNSVNPEAFIYGYVSGVKATNDKLKRSESEIDRLNKMNRLVKDKFFEHVRLLHEANGLLVGACRVIWWPWSRFKKAVDAFMNKQNLA